MCNCTLPIFNYKDFKDFKIVNSVETDLFKVLKDKLDRGEITLQSLRNSEEVPYWLYNELYAYMLEQIRFRDNITTKTKGTTEANLHNYSIAKSFNLIKTIKGLDTEAVTEDVVGVFNVFFNSQQATEDFQTQKVTETASEINNTNYLEYVSRKDSNVRPKHQIADGTILPSNDKHWSVLLSLLTEWNCRCNIIKSNSKQSEVTYTQMKLTPDLKKPNSTIDLRSEKVLIFNEHLPIFDIPTSVGRKNYRRNGF